MEYQVSALKWRPQTFEELVGQEHIVRTLCNAIRLDRVAHAYLFSGTRGVGKTTTARILAKALNCEKGPTTEPCNECSFCVEIRQGNCVDVLEIDGASNNSVAEVRDLIDNVQYAAAACRYKIYIIDEVHMLSRSAFNALLKTLEEPPARVVFIFATTEAMKIPETVLSRCHCFEFKPLTQKQIVDQMRFICDQEGISIDPLSLEQIAKVGAGSMRDSQSRLDQVIAFCGKEINIKSVGLILGIVARDVLETFVDHLAARDPAALIAQVQEVVNDGKDLNYFCRDLIEYVRNLMLVKIAQRSETLVDAQTCNLQRLKEQAEKFHADELHQMFTVLSQAEGQMRRASLPQILFEMALIRLTDVRPFHDIEEMIEKIDRLEDGAGSTENRAQGTVREENSSYRNSSGGSAEPQDTVAGASPDNETKVLWEKIKAEILGKKPHFDRYLEACQMVFLRPSTVQLNFSDPFTLSLVEKEENLKIIKEAVKTVCKNDVEVELNHTEAKGSQDGNSQLNIDGEKKDHTVYNRAKQQSDSQIVQEALDIFGGKVIR